MKALITLAAVVVVATALIFARSLLASGSVDAVSPGATGPPGSDASCAARVTQNPVEPRPDNSRANATVPQKPIPWSDADMGYWKRFLTNRAHVTGNFTGTTNQIIQWAACKWGVNANLLRAVAVVESDWHQRDVGDACGRRGEASYGLFQIKNAYCNGTMAFGGYPAIATSTALNADFYGAYLYSCLHNDFYDGGPWLYRRHTVAQLTATRGRAYVVWGCVGSWFSGRWYDPGAKHYIAQVERALAHRSWHSY